LPRSWKAGIGWVHKLGVSWRRAGSKLEKISIFEKSWKLESWKRKETIFIFLFILFLNNYFIFIFI
jgi:hypothetical protein